MLILILIKQTYVLIMRYKFGVIVFAKFWRITIKELIFTLDAEVFPN